MRKYFLCVSTSFLLAVSFIFSDDAFSQSQRIEIDQDLIRYALIKDRNLINLFAEDFMIPEKKIDQLKIYDITGDGFGQGDLARVFPSGETYFIRPSQKVQRMMNRWTFGSNIKFTAHADDSPDTFESAPDSVRALGGIFAALLRGMRRNYQGRPFKLYMEQQRGVAAIEMWNYEKRLLNYTPPPVMNKEIIKPVYNLIYLEKTISDTVYYSPKRATSLR